jgi:hypothetical protein
MRDMKSTDLASHDQLELANGCVVCRCGHGANPRFLPFFDASAPVDELSKLHSRDVLWEHLRAIAENEAIAEDKTIVEGESRP